MKVHHLPGTDVGTVDSVQVPGTAVEFPVPGDRAVGEVWAALDRAARTWRRRPPAARAERLAEVAEALRRRGPGRWSDPLARSIGLSAAGLRAAWDATCAPHDTAALADALRAEGMYDGIDRELAPRRIVHVLSGNVLPPTFTMLVRGWLLGAAQWLRPASREPLFAACLLEALEEIAPELAATAAVLWWPHGAPLEAAVLREADVVTVQGDDASVAAVGERVGRAAPGARCVGYGTRWSLAVVSRAAEADQTTAGAVAWDMALFDQQGCLSPRLVLAEDCPALEGWCAALAAALAELESEMPRGPLPEPARAALRLWRESMRLEQALGGVRRLWESPKTTAWAVALADRARWLEGPLDRHVPVVPFASDDDIDAVLEDRVERLQGVAAALAGWDEARIRRLLARLRPTRCVPPGQLHLAPPGWAQDHQAPLGSLLRGSPRTRARDRDR